MNGEVRGLIEEKIAQLGEHHKVASHAVNVVGKDRVVEHPHESAERAPGTDAGVGADLEFLKVAADGVRVPGIVALVATGIKLSGNPGKRATKSDAVEETTDSSQTMRRHGVTNARQRKLSEIGCVERYAFEHERARR